VKKSILLWTAVMAVGVALPRAQLHAAEGTSGKETVVLPEGLLDQAEPVRTIEFMSSIPSRLTGSAGCDKAADFIREQFEDIGLENIREHRFSVPVPNDRGCSLSVGSRTYAMHAVWPNLGRASKTVSEGVPGHLIYAGNAEPADCSGLELEGSVVLVDFNCGARWLNMAHFGAIAVVFIEPETTCRREAESKFLNIPASIPRYYIQKRELVKLLGDVLDKAVEEADLKKALLSLNGLEATNVLVKADILWDNRTGRNIIGTIIGSDPELRKETVIIESYYDSISVIPTLAPGAESSCGIAALLEAAKAFKANPPKRTVRFLVTSGHFQALAGMRQWCRDYHVWETLMAKHGIGIENTLFTPPPSIWPTQKELDELEEDEAQPEWDPEEHPIFYAAIDLTSQANQLGIFFKSHFYDVGVQGANRQNETLYRKKFNDIGKNATESATRIKQANGIDTRFVNCIGHFHGRGWRSYVPGPIAIDNEVSLMYGKPGVGLVTINDGRARVDTPLDTCRRADGSAKLDYESARQQAKLAIGLLWGLASRAYEIPRVDVVAAELYVSISEDSLIKFLPGSPLPDSLLAAELNTQKTLMGVRGIAMAIANQEGRCTVVGTQNGNVPYIVCRADRRDGSIEFINQKGLGGARQPNINGKNWQAGRTVDASIALFECSATLFFDLMNQLTYRTLAEAAVLRADSNSAPRNSAVFLGSSSINSSYSEPCGVVFIERGDTSLKIIASAGIVGAKFMLINSPSHETQKLARGMGFPATERENVILRTAYRAAWDMWRLDDFRLDKLERTGVSSERATYLHGLAKDRLEAARKNLGEKDYARFLNNAREAWAYEARAYPNVRGTADDVIKGLIFYLAVLLPFAVFGERLVFTFSDIRKRLLGIAGMFAVIYVVLSRVHPGFELTTTPVIILSGFFMLVLGILTIGILLSKFNTQMALMREKTGTWHRQDVNRSSAAGAAFMLGISNLRRRKIRTLLTCITIVLLTFTVLSFTSFETSVAPNEIPTDYHSAYKGVLVRRRDWSAIEKHASNSLKDYFRLRGGTVTERTWYSALDAVEYMQVDVVRDDNPDLRFQSRGLLGLDPQETRLTLTKPDELLVHGEWLDPDRQQDYPRVCVLPKTIAARKGGLDITEDDVGKVFVKVLGKRLRVVGVADDQKLKNVKDLDNELLTPVDYELQSLSALRGGKQELSADVETGKLSTIYETKPPELYEHIEPAMVVIAPNAFVQTFDRATVRSVAVGLLDLTEDEIIEVLKKYVPRSKLILFAGISEQVKLFSSRDALTAKGMQALFLPIAIASLIVFNTMLGSVYERLREIAVYTSCGLAPVHVAALFLAESCVFATIGAVVGYLLGQGVAKLVTVTGKLQGLNLNYSSVSAVYTIILVVGVVLLSTLYPARKAVQLSVPDETKKMKLPKAQGDMWEFDFPFTVSPVEALGLSAFIHDYFSSHNEDSGGVFCADSVSLRAEEDESGVAYVFDSTVWVEPMDMGISQRVVLATLPPPRDDRVCTIKFTIHRLSGEVETWRRMNFGFLKAIRKQMLIWRLVDAEHKAGFDQQGKELLGRSVET